MRILLHLSLLFFLPLLLLHVANADGKAAKFVVVGFGECADCKVNNFKTSQAFSGLHATIDCKVKTDEIMRVGTSELDNQGKFEISLPQDIVQDGLNLKHECYAQLHSAAAIPCPSHNGLSKITFDKKKNVFAPAKTLKFSTALCTSKILWPYYKYPPHPWAKNVPNIPMPPPVVYQHPLTKPILPPPIVLPPHPPVVLPPLPPLYKKPCPPLPKLPPLPNIPPKYYKHPKYGYAPPTPPSVSHP